MKIGILTFHCAHNFGAVLQCYALQETLKDLGHDVAIINYRPEFLINPYRKFKLFDFGGAKKPLSKAYIFMNEVIKYRLRSKKYDKFEHFINKYLNLTDEIKCNFTPDGYDAIIVGSDQIWNNKITMGYDRMYFCGFDKNKENCKYIAYAASAGKYEFTESEKKFLIERLQLFDSISVRENSLNLAINQLGFTCQNVLDPTLLISSDKWERISAPIQRISKRPYILTYEVRIDKNVQRIANELAQQLGADVITLKSSFYSLINKYQTTSPDEFITLIKNAVCVLTTSFHGTALSIVMQRPFYYIRHCSNFDLRSESLLESIDLMNRMINPNSTPIFSDIDYSRTNSLLKSFKQQSLSYLSNSLN